MEIVYEEMKEKLFVYVEKDGCQEEIHIRYICCYNTGIEAAIELTIPEAKKLIEILQTAIQDVYAEQPKFKL